MRNNYNIRSIPNGIVAVRPPALAGRIYVNALSRGKALEKAQRFYKQASL